MWKRQSKKLVSGINLGESENRYHNLSLLFGILEKWVADCVEYEVVGQYSSFAE
jgi:hypothetical protein